MKGERREGDERGRVRRDIESESREEGETE